MKLERILVGVDFSIQSADAAEWVARVFAPQAKLVLAHVVEAAEPSPSLSPYSYSPPAEVLLAPAFEEAEQKLHALAVRLDAGRARTIVLHPSASRLAPPENTDSLRSASCSASGSRP